MVHQNSYLSLREREIKGDLWGVEYCIASENSQGGKFEKTFLTVRLKTPSQKRQAEARQL